MGLFLTRCLQDIVEQLGKRSPVNKDYSIKKGGSIRGEAAWTAPELLFLNQYHDALSKTERYH